MEQSAFIATGVPRLDLLLGGGIARNSLLLVTGAAGTGKTVLAAQIAFSAAQRGERVLFVTAFSEPHDKLLSNLRAFGFFDANMIGDRIKLLNLQHQLAASIDEAGETLVREARAQRTKLVILDGFSGVSSSSASVLASHIFLYELNAKLSLLGATTLITDHTAVDGVPLRAEMTAVDGIVVLNQEMLNDQAIRVLQVVKQRGAEPLIGRHSFCIDGSGIVCFPRQEALLAADDRALDETDRAQFGIAALDDLLSGGLTRGTNTILAGSTGLGKTLLGLQFLMQGIAAGERALIITFHETAQHMITRGRQFGLDVEAALASGQLQIRHYTIAELNVDIVAQDLRDAADSGIARLLVDSLNELEVPLNSSGRAHGFFASLMALLRTSHITGCFIVEVEPLAGRELSFAGKSYASLAANLIVLRHATDAAAVVGSLGVLKMRFSAHDRQFHPYSIGSTGIQLAGASDEAAAR